MTRQLSVVELEKAYIVVDENEFIRGGFKTHQEAWDFIDRKQTEPAWSKARKDRR